MLEKLNLVSFDKEECHWKYHGTEHLILYDTELARWSNYKKKSLRVAVKTGYFTLDWNSTKIILAET